MSADIFTCFVTKFTNQNERRLSLIQPTLTLSAGWPKDPNLYSRNKSNTNKPKFQSEFPKNKLILSKILKLLELMHQIRKLLNRFPLKYFTIIISIVGYNFHSIFWMSETSGCFPNLSSVLGINK